MVLGVVCDVFDAPGLPVICWPCSLSHRPRGGLQNSGPAISMLTHPFVGLPFSPPNNLVWPSLWPEPPSIIELGRGFENDPSGRTQALVHWLASCLACWPWSTWLTKVTAMASNSSWRAHQHFRPFALWTGCSSVNRCERPSNYAGDFRSHPVVERRQRARVGSANR